MQKSRSPMNFFIENRDFRLRNVVTLCGPDGSSADSYENILILNPQTSKKEALLLLKIHREGKSSVLPD